MFNSLTSSYTDTKTLFWIYVEMPTEINFIWLSEMNGSDFQRMHLEEPLLRILGWLQYVKIKTAVEFTLDDLIVSLQSAILPVLRCIKGGYSNCDRFPYQKDTLNEWFSIPPRDESNQQEAVGAINIKPEEGATVESSTILTSIQYYLSSPSGDKFELLFHGTGHESAKDIIELGIDVRKGRPRQDFSNGDGFYVGNDFDEARRWPSSRGYRHAAVLVFQIRKTELRGEGSEYKGLDLRSDKKEWQNVTAQYRSGEPKRGFRKEMKKYDYIEGPMASVGKMASMYLPQRDDSYQLCIRKDKCSKMFDRSLRAVVFF
ncbi:uncharacterized protein [Montipora foliosa]|uniref:uncharacterized protein n=1 Tax=Montipora foliosa TaxID=591990 RepID=UPI0035F17B86